MRYVTFQAPFHAPIRAGIKRSTIRPNQRFNPGERFALRYWTGLPYRSGMGWLGTAHCVLVAPCLVTAGAVVIDGQAVDVHALARQEGFASDAALHAWFAANHGPQFTGWIHVWRDFAPGAAT
jgi:hypothetical protein